MSSVSFDKPGLRFEDYDYGPFGDSLGGNRGLSWSGMRGAESIGFTGQRLDAESGLYHFAYREYDSLVAQWTTSDPIKDGEAWYGYCGNNPVGFTDPTGLCFKTEDDKAAIEAFEANAQAEAAGWAARDAQGQAILDPEAVIAPEDKVPVELPPGRKSQLMVLFLSLIDTAGELSQAGYERALRMEGSSPYVRMGLLPDIDEEVDSFLDAVSLGVVAAGNRAITGVPRTGAGTLRNPNKLAPAEGAVGPNTSFRRDIVTGRVTNYETYEINPYTGEFTATLRFRGVGKPHGGVNPPLVLRPQAGKGIGSPPIVPSPASPGELPLGYK